MTLTLTWNPNPAGEQVTGYEVWQGVNGGVPSLVTTAPADPAPSYVLNNPPTGVYSFLLKAINIAGKSGNSAAIQGPGAPTAPTGGVVTVTV